MNDIPLLVDEFSLLPVPKMVRLRPLSLKVYRQRFCGGVSMLDLSKISTDLLSVRRNAFLERYLEHREFMKFYYMQFLEVDAEIERRKVLDKDDRKKQMVEAMSKLVFESTHSKRTEGEG